MMRTLPAPKSPGDRLALRRLGTRIRDLRRAQGLSRSELSRKSQLSLRFLAQLEAGSGNISYLRLRELARALETDAAALIDAAERLAPRAVALLGMRGAGKSTVGEALAGRLGCPFQELDELVETEAGMPLAQIFELQGAAFYRELERETLVRVLAGGGESVLATGGGIVTETATYDLLRRRTYTVWLKTTPRDHWDRVVAQGDRRPMHNRPGAMAELERLWETRARRYADADLIVETTARTVEDVVREIEEHFPRSG